jgi:hypothetical protein
MAFTVKWADDLDDALASIWLVYPDRPAVTAAQATIDTLLRADPEKYGEYLSEGLWRIHIPPLLAHFTIDDLARRVDVTNLHILPARN